MENRYTLPYFPEIGNNRPDEFIASASIHLLDSFLLYIYPISSPLNCSGTVSGVGFCFLANTLQLNTSQLIFTLVTLQQQGGLMFSVTASVPVSITLSTQNCTRSQDQDSTELHCCASYPLRNNQFQLRASSNFTFGILPSSDVSIYGFNSGSFSQYRVQHRTALPYPIVVGSTISASGLSTMGTLRLFQFFIGKSLCQHSRHVRSSTNGVNALALSSL
jgi:hypothetical protein